MLFSLDNSCSSTLTKEQREEKGAAVEEKLNRILEKATKNVRPSSRLIRLYNVTGKLPFNLGTVLFRLTSINGRELAKFASEGRTDAALQIMYNYNGFSLSKELLSLGEAFWQNSYNARSVRARGEFVKKAGRLILSKLEDHGKPNPLKIASLGSGSANQLLEGIASTRLNSARSEVTLVDFNAEALKSGEKKAKNLEVNVQLENKTIGQFLSRTSQNHLHLIEMVGIADYLKQHQLKRYLPKIRSKLDQHGLFIGANISSKLESNFAHQVACWPSMYYRTSKELIQFLGEAGFNTIWMRKCGLYSVWVAQKI